MMILICDDDDYVVDNAENNLYGPTDQTKKSMYCSILKGFGFS